MNDETKDRLRKRFDQMLDSPEMSSPLVTLADLESLALTLRDQIAQATLDEAEQEIRDEVHPTDSPRPETETDSAAVTALSSGSSRMPCPTCGKSAWNKGRRSRRFVTLAGVVRFWRDYFYCRRCHHGFCPHDARLGVPPNTDFTPRLVQEVACLSACLPFEQAVETLARLTHVSVSPRSAERLCVGVAGTQAEAYRAERDARSLPLALVSPSAFSALPVSLPRPDVLYVEADGIQTPMKGGQKEGPKEGNWREMKIGVVRGMHRDGREAAPSRYVNLLGTAHDFGPRLESLAIDSGSLTAKKVVVLGDGAAWLWKMASTHFPTATHILDFWHALEYVGTVMREAFVLDGPSGIEQAKGKAWLAARAQEMKQSAWPRFFAALEAVRAKPDRSDKANEAVTAVVRYFGNHHSRMDYARYLKEGLSIGSGLAESACKRMVTQRLKGSGMHWGEVGAQAVCALRCLLFSGEWEAFTNHQNRTFKTDAHSPLS